MSHQEARITPPSFVDLRRFAKAAELGAQPPTATLAEAFLASRRVLDVPDGPVEIGAIDLPSGQGAVGELPADEFVIVSSGKVTLTQPARTLVLTNGASAVLPRGAGFGWSCETPTTLLYMRYKGATPADATLVPIDEAAPLAPSGTPMAELLIGPTPECRNHTDFRSADGEFVCGTWDSTPYRRRPMLFRHYELMHLLEGAVTLDDELGERRTFSKGDIFLVEQGARCGWESREHVKKVYAIYRPG